MALSPVALTGGDSADPKKILNDLQQLAMVCQRLGIDLSKTAAMGQSVAGGGQQGSPLQTQNQSHANAHAGGGTGYQNMAMGQIIGGSGVFKNMGDFEERLRKKAKSSPDGQAFGYGFKPLNTQLVDDIANSEWVKGRANPYVGVGGHGVIRTQRGEMYRITGGQNRPKSWIKFSELWRVDTRADVTDSAGHPISGFQNDAFKPVNVRSGFAYKMRGPSLAYEAGYGYGMGSGSSNFLNVLRDKEAKKFAKIYMGIEGIRIGHKLLTQKIDYAAGETFWNNAGKEATNLAISGFEMAAGAYIHSTVYPAAAAAFARSTGSIVARVAAGGAAAGGSIVAAVTNPVTLSAAATVFVFKKAFDLTEEDARSRNILEVIKNTTTGEMHVKKGAKKFKLSEDGEYKFNESVDQGQSNYYIDPETGERKERSGWDKWWYNRAFVRLWGRDADAKAEKEWRIKEVAKLHETAKQKANVMDWEGAIEDASKAKELVVVEEAMPFFWKEPEKYLRAMEASRIAGRNWARAQQPRGGSRTGD
jgi:hypothetical protein